MDSPEKNAPDEGVTQIASYPSIRIVSPATSIDASWRNYESSKYFDELYKKDRGNTIYVFYSDGLSNEDQLDALKKGEFDLSDLVFHQMKTNYFGDKLIQRPYDNTKMAEIIERHAIEPNFDYPQRSTRTDQNENVLFAFKILQGKVVCEGNKITTIDQLSAICRDNKIPINYITLIEGFDGLLSKVNILRFTQEGVIHNNEIPSIYERAASFMTELALHATGENPSKRAEIVLPYPVGGIFEDTQLPDLYFLPFITYSFLEYMVRLPEYIKEGGQIGLDSLIRAVNQLGDLNKATITRDLQHLAGTTEELPFDQLVKMAKANNPEAIQGINEVNNSINEIAPLLGRVISHYKNNPFLINKFLPKHEGSGSVITYPQWRHELLETGARAPRKPMSFRYKYDLTKK
ncbi:MAG TPA: hypothetical protein VG917_00535 [Patescibacteria group bacterium]|nr:hypothetical protein [Patescibacteria group bacterium]